MIHSLNIQDKEMLFLTLSSKNNIEMNFYSEGKVSNPYVEGDNIEMFYATWGENYIKTENHFHSNIIKITSDNDMKIVLPQSIKYDIDIKAAKSTAINDGKNINKLTLFNKIELDKIYNELRFLYLDLGVDNITIKNCHIENLEVGCKTKIKSYNNTIQNISGKNLIINGDHDTLGNLNILGTMHAYIYFPEFLEDTKINFRSGVLDFDLKENNYYKQKSTIKAKIYDKNTNKRLVKIKSKTGIVKFDL